MKRTHMRRKLVLHHTTAHSAHTHTQRTHMGRKLVLHHTHTHSAHTQRTPIHTPSTRAPARGLNPAGAAAHTLIHHPHVLLPDDSSLLALQSELEALGLQCCHWGVEGREGADTGDGHAGLGVEAAYQGHKVCFAAMPSSHIAL